MSGTHVVRGRRAIRNLPRIGSDSDEAPICFIPGTLDLGGIGRNTLNLGEELTRRGYPVDLFLTREGGVYAAQVPSSIRLFIGEGSATRSISSLIAYLRRRRPRVIISAHPHIHLLVLIAARLARGHTRVVCTVRTNISVDRKSKGAYRNILIEAARYAYRRADAVVAVSEGVADDLAAHAGIPRGDVRVIYNPALTRRLLEQETLEIDCSWLMERHAPVIVSVGRLTKQKDFPTLVRALAHVREVLPDCRLVILGEGEERSSIESLVQELGLGEAVLMPGFVPNPAAYVARASLFALSSAWEGFGNVLVEAMAVGTPVVATDCPSGPAEILEHGSFGRMVPVGDYLSLAEAIINELRTPTPANVLRQRAEMFSAESAADQWLELIAGLPSSPLR
jgi:glycosyltransferase involved in cell wall biosynthesis